MKVKDLIEELEMYDKHLDVLVNEKIISKIDIVYINSKPIVNIFSFQDA